MQLRDNSDTLLVQIPLIEPCGSVNGTTGVATLAAAGTGTAVATGTASYATIYSGGGVALRSVPCQAGSTQVPGVCVVNTTSVITGAVISINSFVML